MVCIDRREFTYDEHSPERRKKDKDLGDPDKIAEMILQLDDAGRKLVGAFLIALCHEDVVTRQKIEDLSLLQHKPADEVLNLLAHEGSEI